MASRLQAQTWTVSVRFSVGARAVRRAAQPCAFVRELPGLRCRCALRLDQGGGFRGCERAEFFDFLAGGRCLRVGVAGFAFGADEPGSYRVASRPFDIQLPRK